jgi:hypothetical protein
MIPRTLLFAFVAFAAASFVAANSASDVCQVEISVDYGDLDARSFTFTLSRDTSSASAVLPPGTFDIDVTASSCDDQGQVSGVAFQGSAENVQINGDEQIAKQITISSVDSQNLQDADLGVEFPPIITSLTVSPAVAKYGEVVTMTATGLKLPTGNPDSYTLDFASDATVASSPSAEGCSDGDLSTCAITYTPGSPDTGNIDFTFSAIVGQLTSVNNPTGFFLVDPNADVEISITQSSSPAIDTDNVVFLPTDLHLTASDSSDNTLAVQVKVLDKDFLLSNDNQESITLSVNVEKKAFYGGEDSDNLLQEIPCGSATGAESQPQIEDGGSDSDNFVSYSLGWDPTQAVDTSAEGFDWNQYGTTTCTFTIQATDSQSLTSQELTFDVVITGNGVSLESETKAPQILSLMHEKSVEAGSGVTTPVHVRYQDVDDNVEVYASNTDLSIDENTAASAVASKDCQSTPCTATLELAIDTASAGDYAIDIILKDDAGNEISQTITVTVTAASGGRRRRAANVVSLFNTEFRMEDGKLVASIPEEVFAQMDDPPIFAEEPEDAPQNPGNPNTPPDNQGMASSTIAAIAGGAAGFLVIVGAVAAVVVSRRRQNAKADMADRVSCSWDLTVPEEQKLGRRSTKWDKVELPAHESLP